MKKYAIRITAFMLTVLISLCCLPTAYAQSNDINFEEGAVLVGFYADAGKIQDLAPELEIERVELAEMDHDYVPYVNTSKYKFVKVTLTEKTKQTTLDAIELFKSKEEVIVSEPYYTVYSLYNPGDVLVSLEMGKSPEVLNEVLKDYEIENIRLLTPGSSTQNVYCITFAEKTKEVVAKTIPILKTCKDVRIAEPNFIGEFTVVPTKGDADRDNRVTVMDATIIQKYLAQQIKASEFDYEAAIVTDNYCLTIIDATAIQKTLAGIEVDFLR